MQGEEHLVFSQFPLTGRVMDGTFTPSQAQIWTYTFGFYGPANGQSYYMPLAGLFGCCAK